MSEPTPSAVTQVLAGIADPETGRPLTTMVFFCFVRTGNFWAPRCFSIGPPAQMPGCGLS